MGCSLKITAIDAVFGKSLSPCIQWTADTTVTFKVFSIFSCFIFNQTAVYYNYRSIRLLY